MLKKDVTATFASNAVLTVLATGSSIITARALGASGRGMLALALVIPGVVSTFATFGQEVVNATFAGLYKQARGRLLLHSLGLLLLSAAISFLAVFSFFYWLPIPRGEFGSLSFGVVLASCVVAPLTVGNVLVTALVRGVGKITAAAGLRVVQGGSNLLLLFAFLVLRQGGVLAAVLIAGLAQVPSMLAALWFLRGELKPQTDEQTAPLPLLVMALKFGLPVCLATFASVLVYRLNQGILAYAVDERQLGLYSVAVSLAEQVKILPAAIGTAFLPILANELSTRQAQVPLVFRTSLLVSVAAMIVVALLGGPAIILCYGWEFTGAIPCFMVLLPGVAALGGASVLASDLLVRKLSKYSVITAYAALGSNVLLNLLLIPLIGISGSALASSLAYSVATLLWIRFYLKESSRSVSELVPRRSDVAFVWRHSVQMARQTVRSSLRWRRQALASVKAGASS